MIPLLSPAVSTNETSLSFYQSADHGSFSTRVARSGGNNLSMRRHFHVNLTYFKISVGIGEINSMTLASEVFPIAPFPRSWLLLYRFFSLRHDAPRSGAVA